MIFLEIESFPDFPASLLEKAAAETLKHAAAPDADLTIVLTDDREIRTLNRDFLGIDAPTDVLSFPADEIDPETGRRYLGDVVISVQRAQQQATEGGHSLEEEVQLLVVHGVLHLLGYDHAEPEEKEQMWKLQGDILDALGIHPSYPA